MPRKESPKPVIFDVQWPTDQPVTLKTIREAYRGVADSAAVIKIHITTERQLDQVREGLPNFVPASHYHHRRGGAEFEVGACERVRFFAQRNLPREA